MTSADSRTQQPALADDLALLKDAAREAGRIALRFFGKNPDVWMKGGTSPVSEADIEADRYLMRRLMDARPDHGWLSEETADNPSRLKAPRTFVVDPIDGTRAFIDGRSTWCVSVAIVENGRTVAGVLDCPAKGEVYEAAAGHGAFLNGRRLALGMLPDVVRIGGAKQLLDLVDEPLQSRMKRISYVPSLAYRLAMVAAGEMDATFVKPNSHDWDLAAAALILQEAGGVLRNAADEPVSFAGVDVRHGALAAGHPDLLHHMTATLGRFR